VNLTTVLLILSSSLNVGLAKMLATLLRPKEITLIMAMKLDATTLVDIDLKGKDSEGNAVPLPHTDVTLEITNPVGDFGTLTNDGTNWVFNPGAAGATGTITGKVTLHGVEHVASVDLELVPGEATTFELDFVPVV